MKDWQKQKNRNRKATFAGQFYPRSKTDLEETLDGLFRNAKGKTENTTQLRALISPHAGYIFSGRVAASAFNQIPENKEYNNIFVIASSHQYHFNGVAVYNKGNFETPMGEIIVDVDLCNRFLESSEIFKDQPEAHEFEHSLEVQLPFIQYKLGNKSQLVPLIIGTDNPEHCKQLANVLKPWFTQDNLFIISTDFSHYPEYQDANLVDSITAEAVCSNNPDKLLKVLGENKKRNIKNLATSMCGWTSVLTLIYLTEGDNFIYNKIEYQNSGDANYSGERDRVVGYWAISVCSKENHFYLSEEEKTELLNKARAAIVHFIKTGKRGNIVPPHSDGILNEIAGAFVSIYINKKLRGCIGGFAQDKTLNEVVQKAATSAACDYRFNKISQDELEIMTLEISVLSPLKRIDSVDQIELGKHGIYIKKGLNTGTFLPQVATKTGWDLENYLGHCSRDKAGLKWEEWKEADIFAFEAFVFSEKSSFK